MKFQKTTLLTSLLFLLMVTIFTSCGRPLTSPGDKLQIIAKSDGLRNDGGGNLTSSVSYYMKKGNEKEMLFNYKRLLCAICRLSVLI